MNQSWQPALLASAILVAAPSAAPPSTVNNELLARNYYVVETSEPEAPAVDDGENPLDFDVFWKDSLNFHTKDKSVKLKIGGRIHFDATMFSENIERKSDAATGGANILDFENGAEFRRARLYLSGTVAKDLDFKLQVDFASDDTGADLKDGYVNYKSSSGVNFKVGQFNEPMSFAELTSSNSLSFLERAPVTGLTPVRSTGAMVHGNIGEQRLTYALGIFKDEDDVGRATGTGEFAITGRVTALVVDSAKTLVHAGFSSSKRDATDGNFDNGFRPPAHLSPTVINNDAFAADDSLVVAAEVAVVHGPFWASSEYIQTKVEARDGMADARLHGYYFAGGYFLTGETRPYSRKKGAFGTLKPLRPRGGTDGGCGAWEVAFRYSMFEFEEVRFGGNVFDDELSSTTFGVNWYWNTNFRLMFHYVMFDLDSKSLGFQGDGDAALTRFSLFL